MRPVAYKILKYGPIPVQIYQSRLLCNFERNFHALFGKNVKAIKNPQTNRKTLLSRFRKCKLASLWFSPRSTFCTEVIYICINVLWCPRETLLRTLFFFCCLQPCWSPQNPLAVLSRYKAEGKVSREMCSSYFETRLARPTFILLESVSRIP